MASQSHQQTDANNDQNAKVTQQNVKVTHQNTNNKYLKFHADQNTNKLFQNNANTTNHSQNKSQEPKSNHNRTTAIDRELTHLQDSKYAKANRNDIDNHRDSTQTHRDVTQPHREGTLIQNSKYIKANRNEIDSQRFQDLRINIHDEVADDRTTTGDDHNDRSKKIDDRKYDHKINENTKLIKVKRLEQDDKHFNGLTKDSAYPESSESHAKITTNVPTGAMTHATSHHHAESDEYSEETPRDRFLRAHENSVRDTQESHMQSKSKLSKKYLKKHSDARITMSDASRDDHTQSEMAGVPRLDLPQKEAHANAGEKSATYMVSFSVSNSPREKSHEAWQEKKAKV